jgi:hypothetical protein
MDELIRELEALRDKAKASRSRSVLGSDEWVAYDVQAVDFALAVRLAREAKRRMADREPTWPVA